MPDFGRRVADLVDALTVYPDADGGGHEDSWRRIAVTPGAVAVKLADRIANVRRRGDARVDKYRGQQPVFRALLADADRGECPPDAIARMWVALDAALG